MKKAASIFLRADITLRDVDRMICWMENPNVTRFLNEDAGIVYFLRQLAASVPEPMLSYHFRRTGHFFMVCPDQEDSVGFVRLSPLPETGTYEIVYVIGEEARWGHGLGESAIRAALSEAFLTLDAQKLVAKIMPENRRSVRSVAACGFARSGVCGGLMHYAITQEAYFQHLRAQSQQRA